MAATYNPDEEKVRIRKEDSKQKGEMRAISSQQYKQTLHCGH